MSARSRLFRGEVVHVRFGPEKHRFSYPLTFFGFDLQELPSLGKSLSLFSYNEANILSLKDRDYLRGKAEPINKQLSEFLASENEGEHTLLVTSPKYFNYAFNPVSFHLRMSKDRLVGAVVEVNNTFGDRHIYPLTDLVIDGDYTWRAKCVKDFHVSPFNDVNGHYHFTFRLKGESIFLGVDLHREGRCVMKTWLRGKARELTAHQILKHALLCPLDTAMNSFPRILWQAAVLFYKRKLAVFKRPKPNSELTVIDRDFPEGRRPII